MWCSRVLLVSDGVFVMCRSSFCVCCSFLSFNSCVNNLMSYLRSLHSRPIVLLVEMRERKEASSTRTTSKIFLVETTQQMHWM